jgi:hypothetical protein
MFNKKSVIILCVILHLAISLKSSNFCFIKQQVCKGFYNEYEMYQTKCEKMNCHGKFNYDCGFHVCSNNMTDCNSYKQFDSYIKLILQMQSINSIITSDQIKTKKSFKMFNKQIRSCQNQNYEFKSDDFCLNGKDCKIVKNYSFHKIKFMKSTVCKCPIKQSFRCGEYCTSDSIACDYHRLNENKSFLVSSNINNCGNQNVTILKSNFINLW